MREIQDSVVWALVVKVVAAGADEGGLQEHVKLFRRNARSAMYYTWPLSSQAFDVTTLRHRLDWWNVR